MSSQPKIAVIGAGSYVFSLGLLYDLIVKHRLSGVQLVLMDVNESMAETMAGIARRMMQESGVTLDIRATADRDDALDSADFVTTSVVYQLLKRYQMDREVLFRYGIKEISSECGGLGGLSYTLRQVPLIMDIARDMERLCPHAWLLNSSNPLPRVITAVSKFTKIRALGFCNVAWGAEDGYGNIARLLTGELHTVATIS